MKTINLTLRNAKLTYTIKLEVPDNQKRSVTFVDLTVAIRGLFSDGLKASKKVGEYIWILKDPIQSWELTINDSTNYIPTESILNDTIELLETIYSRAN